MFFILGVPVLTGALAGYAGYRMQAKDGRRDDLFVFSMALLGWLPLSLILITGSSIHRYNERYDAFEKSCTGQVHKLHRGALCISSDGRILGTMP